jgi:hypothetical protein
MTNILVVIASAKGARQSRIAPRLAVDCFVASLLAMTNKGLMQETVKML